MGLVEERLEVEPTEKQFNPDGVFNATEAKRLRGIVDSAVSDFTRTKADSREWITADADWDGGTV